MRNHIGKLCLLAALLTFSALVVSAQYSTMPAVTPAGVATASVAGASFEQYNGFNGSLELSIPLHHIGGRGEAGFDLVWNLQPNWIAAYEGTPASTTIFAEQYPGSDRPPNNSSGLGGPGGVFIRTGYTWINCGGTLDEPSTSVTTVVFVTPNGSQITLTDSASNGAAKPTPYNFCNNTVPPQWDAGRGTSFRSTDGSQIQFNASANVQEQADNTTGYGAATVSGTLVFPSGVTYHVTDSKIDIIEDRNGNKISLTYAGSLTTLLDWHVNIPPLTQITDSLGRVTTINYNYSDSSGNCGSCIGIIYPGANNSTHIVKVLSGSLDANLRSDFAGAGTKTIAQLFSSALFGSSASYNPTVATAVVLPDATEYTFQYNPWGEVARLMLPTGGAIEYDYAAGSGSAGGFLQGPSSGSVMIYRRLTQRREYATLVYQQPPSLTSTTIHSFASASGATTDTVQVQDPNNNNAIVSSITHTYQGSPTDVLTMNATGCNTVNEGIETSTAIGSLRTITYTYTNGTRNGNAVSCLYNPQLTTVTTSQAGLTSHITYTYDQAPSNPENIDSYNNITDEKDYDWDNSTLLREITTSYVYGSYDDARVNLIHLPSTKTIVGGSETEWYYDEQGPDSASGITNNDTSGYGPANNLRGNMTDSYMLLNGQKIKTLGATYDVAGNLKSSSDADNNKMTYLYNDSAGFNAFPVSITNVLGQASTFTYDYNAGKPLTFVDAANNKTQYSYSNILTGAPDPFDRIGTITDPTSALKQYYYEAPNWLIINQQQTSSVYAQSQVVSDGFGRDIEDRQILDGSHLIAVDHVYDALGRIYQQKNPSQVVYSPSSWDPDNLGYPTQYAYDFLNRVTQITYPDGNSVSTTYSSSSLGQTATSSDSASRSTQSITDALGRLTTFYEDSGSSNLQTNYTYDTMGNLTQVLKCTAGIACGPQNPSGQIHAYTYDSLGRLMTASTPESGTYSYGYTNSSGAAQLALQTRTDPRSYTTTYTRDPLDRVTAITYTDGTPNAAYTYDAVGNLTQSSNGNVTNNYLAFDGDNRVTSSSVVTAGVTYNFGYVYDLAGDLTQETYPSGRQVNYTSYDTAFRPQAATYGFNGNVSGSYVQSVGYFPHGAPQFWQYGNNLYNWQVVNKMLTSQETWATQNNDGSKWMFIAYNGYDNSENVVSQTEGFGPGVPWNNMTFLNGQFQYDGLNRLFSVTDTNYTRTYHYDEFGNQSIQSYTGISPVGYAPLNTNGNPFNPATNHMVSVDAAGGYERRGMVTKLGVGPTVTMDYDAEGNMKDTNYPGSGPSITWIYDAEGQRAQQRVAGGSWTLYIHDAFGQLAATYNNNGVTPACTTCYLTYDMLGSVRLVTDQNQNVVARHDFIPFGEEIPDGTAGRVGNFAYTSNVTQAFTGQEEDGGNAVLHYFNARHLSGALGSFMQPDPGNAGAILTNPQSWNGYAYVLGNPLTFTDPNGRSSVNPIQSGGSCADICFSTLVFGSPLVSGSFVGGLTGLGASGAYRTQYYGTDPLFTDVTFGKGLIPTVDVSLSSSLLFPAKNGTKQTFSQCMAAHANDFSIAGTLNHTYNAITGSNSLAFQNNFFAQAVLGNPITTLAYGSATDNAGTAASLAPTIVQMGMGTVTSYGRRTTTIMALNLAGKGGVPLALGAASAGTKAAIGRVANVAGGFMSLEVSLAVNVGFTAAEAAYCASQP